MIFFAPSPSIPSTHSGGPPTHTVHETTKTLMQKIFRAARLPALQLLMPQMAYQGSAQTFSMGVLPRLIGGTVADRAYMFLAYGCVGSVCSLIYGKMFDRWGWQWLVGVQVAATLLLHAFTLGVDLGNANIHLLIFSGAIASAIDNAANSLNNMTISKVISFTMCMLVFHCLRVFIYFASYVPTQICLFVCLFICVSVCLCLYIYVYICIYVCKYICIYVCIYICMFVCVYVCVCNYSSV